MLLLLDGAGGAAAASAVAGILLWVWLRGMLERTT